jgi:hypothetical protein
MSGAEIGEIVTSYAVPRQSRAAEDGPRRQFGALSEQAADSLAGKPDREHDRDDS